MSDEAVRRLAGDPDDNRQWLALDLLDARAELERQRPVIEAAREQARVSSAVDEDEEDWEAFLRERSGPVLIWLAETSHLETAIRALDGKQSDYSPRNPNDGYPPMEGK